jgi:hypothetical protein
MKRTLIAALVTAAFGTTAAMAQTLNFSQPLDLTDNTGFFGDTFAANNGGATFNDRFTFTVGSDSGPLNMDAVVSSISRTSGTGIDITGLSMYSASGRSPVTSGTSFSSGTLDVWTIAGNNLVAGDYYLQVNGTVLSNDAASFGGSVALAPVPEPETYGMMLGGLGLLGFLARRRRGGDQP